MPSRFEDEVVPRRNAPAGFYCPLTGIIMRDPVILRDSGISYERGAIEWALYIEPARCPVTGIVLGDSTVDTDLDLRARIEAWAETNQPELLVRLMWYMPVGSLLRVAVSHCTYLHASCVALVTVCRILVFALSPYGSAMHLT